jgi:hypothetical protein
MANQPHNPQQQQGQQQRPQPPKQAPGQGQAGKSSGSEPGPQNPADLGHDPKPDNIQARQGQKGMGQSSEKH